MCSQMPSACSCVKLEGRPVSAIPVFAHLPRLLQHPCGQLLDSREDETASAAVLSAPVPIAREHDEAILDDGDANFPECLDCGGHGDFQLGALRRVHTPSDFPNGRGGAVLSRVLIPNESGPGRNPAQGVQLLHAPTGLGRFERKPAGITAGGREGRLLDQGDKVAGSGPVDMES